MAAYGWALPKDALVTSVLVSCNEFWGSPSFDWLFVGHALFCCLAGPEFKDRWLVHLLLTYLWGNGGGLVTALLIQNPAQVTLSFFQSDFIPGTWLVCWWLVNWAPGGFVRRVCDTWYIKLVTKSCTMLLRAQLMVARVDLGVQLYPGVAAAPLILGTLGGCGGRLLADAIMYGWQAMPGLAELSSPGFVSRSAALAASTYYALAHGLRLMPQQAAAGLVVTALMLHSFASDLLGAPLDFTAPIAQLLHVVSRVPLPPPQPHLQAATVRASSRTPGSSKQQPQRAQATPTKSPGTPAAAKKPAGAITPAPAPAAASPATGSRKRREAGGAAAALSDDEGATKQLARRGSSKTTAVAGASEAAAPTRRSQRRAAAPTYA